MKRKPIFEYRLNGNDSSDSDIINFAFGLNTELWYDIFSDTYDKPNITEAIQIIREHGHTVEYLGS